MINLEEKYLNYVRSVLKKHVPQYTVWLFGSRATSTIKPYSDIDLVIISDQSVSSNAICLMTLEFAESDLPYKVDLVDWSTLDDEFKKIIRNRYEVIQYKNSYEKPKNL